MSSLFLSRPKGSHRKSKCLGRGIGCGSGKTSGRGHKGQKARSGSPRVGFEGGQTPFFRRIPRRGFSNFRHKIRYGIVNLGDIEKKFVDGDIVNFQSLFDKGLLRKRDKNVKILSGGSSSFTKVLNFEVVKLSESTATLLKDKGCGVVLLPLA